MARRSTNVNKSNSKKKIDTQVENNTVENKENSAKKSENKPRDLKCIIKEYFNEYKENLKTKHIVCFIIMIVIFGLTIISYVSNLQNQDFLEQVQNITGEYVSENVFTKILSNKLPAVAIIIIAGVTPFIYASALGVLFSYQMAEEMITVLSVANSSGNVILMSVGAIIQCIGFSLAVATGIYWCKISGKRRRYANGTQKSFLDVKKELYSLTNNKKKIKELEKKRKEKNEKIQKYNVEIPYLTLITSFVVSFIIVVIGTFIFYI